MPLWVVSSFLQGYQLPKLNNQLWLDCHPNFLPLLLMSTLIVLWFDDISRPCPPILETWLNMVWYKERNWQGIIIRFRRINNTLKITKRRDTNIPTIRNNRHYTDLITSVPNNPPIHLLIPLLHFNCIGHDSVSHFIQLIWLASSPNLVSTIMTNIMSPPFKINIIQITYFSWKRGTRAAVNTPPNNQQASHVVKGYNNGDSIVSSDLSNLLSPLLFYGCFFSKIRFLY